MPGKPCACPYNQVASHTFTPLGTGIIAAPAHIQDPAERIGVDITLNPQPTDAASSIFTVLLFLRGREIGDRRWLCLNDLHGNKLHGRHRDLAESLRHRKSWLT